MKKNMGVADRVIRTIVGLLIVGAILRGYVAGTLAIILGVLAAALLLTSLFGVCLLYIPFRYSTLKE